MPTCHGSFDRPVRPPSNDPPDPSLALYHVRGSKPMKNDHAELCALISPTPSSVSRVGGGGFSSSEGMEGLGSSSLRLVFDYVYFFNPARDGMKINARRHRRCCCCCCLLFRFRFLLCIHTRREHKFESPKLKINRFIAHEIFHSSVRPSDLSYLVSLADASNSTPVTVSKCSSSIPSPTPRSRSSWKERQRELGDHNKRLPYLGADRLLPPAPIKVSRPLEPNDRARGRIPRAIVKCT